MTRSVFPGDTDYSHQTLRVLLSDLEGILSLLNSSQAKLKRSRERLEAIGYWHIAFVDFRSLFNYSIQFYDTCIEEVTEILTQIQIEVQSHHANQLAHLSETAAKLNETYGITWHGNDSRHQYSDPNFRVLADMYSEGRQMAVDLIDLSNMAVRLRVFIGKTLPIHSNAIFNTCNDTKLREQLEGSFSLDEIKSLCQDLNVPYDDLGGDARSAKCRELIYYCKRHDIIDCLLGRCSVLRPKASWW